MAINEFLFERIDLERAGELEELIQLYGAELSQGRNGESVKSCWGHELLKKDFVHTYGIFSVVTKALVGFAIVFELPEAVFKTLSGQLDDLFVLPAYRGKRLAAALVEKICDEGKKRGWSHLRWSVPESDSSALQLYRRISQEAPWKNFLIRFNSTVSL